MNLHQAIAKLWLALPTIASPKIEEAARAAVIALGVDPDGKRVGDTMKAIAEGALELEEAAPFYVFRAPRDTNDAMLESYSATVRELGLPAIVLPHGFALDPINLPRLAILRDIIDSALNAERPADPEAEPRSVTASGDTLADGLVRAADLAEHYRLQCVELASRLKKIEESAHDLFVVQHKTSGRYSAPGGLETNDPNKADLYPDTNRMTAHGWRYVRVKVIKLVELVELVEAPKDEPLPVFPDIGCKCDPPECGFISAGLGYQCLEGRACGRYIHPGDPHFEELRDYDRKMTALSER